MMDALNNPGTMILLLLLALALLGGAKAWRLRLEWAAFQQWRSAGMPAPQETTQAAPGGPIGGPGVSFDPTPLAGAGRALARPPADFRVTLQAVRALDLGPYAFPLGWEIGGLATAKFVGDVNHILITGQTDAGKDNTASNIIYTLAAQNRPNAVQFALLDGKGLDWSGWAGKAHTWRLAMAPEDIYPAMLAISAERARRLNVLQSAGVKKWDRYTGGDLPLLVVYISELLLLQNATSGPKLAAWLSAELVAGRAFGIRYIIATQTASNFDTQWRAQISLFLAGYQPTPTQDMPNTGTSTKELAELGAIPPSQLPDPSTGGQGVFTAIQGRHVATVRAGLISDDQHDQLLAMLPAAPARPAAAARPAAPDSAMMTLQELLQAGQPLPVADEVSSGAIAHSEGIKAASVAGSSSSALVEELSADSPPPALVVAAEVVPPDEQLRIIEAARSLASRRQVSLKLYEATGGQRYTWVQLVCDAAGLLPVKGGA